MDVEIGDTLLELADAGDLQDAIALCRSLARRPKKGEDREKLRAVARKLTERFPDEPSLHLAVSTMLLRSGTLREAHEHLRQMKRAFPDEPGVHERLGEVLLRMGDARGAVIALERALTEQPDVAVEEVLTEARVLTRLQDGRGAEAVAAEAKDILGDPSEPLAVRRRGLSNVKTPIVNDVRALVDGLASARPPTPGRSVSPRGGPGAASGYASHAPPPLGSHPPPAFSHAPPSGSIPPPAPDLPHLKAKAEEPPVSRRSALLAAGAAVAVLAGGGLLARRYLGQSAGLDRALVDLAIEAMISAVPSQLDRATVLTRRALAQAPRSSEAAVRALQAAIFGLLDGRESRGGLEAALDEAKARGAAPPEVAPAEALLLAREGRAADARARLENVQPGSHAVDALVLSLVRGVALEGAADPAAAEAFGAALAAEPKGLAAALRLFRHRLVEGDEAGATKALASVEATGQVGKALGPDLHAAARLAGFALPGAPAGGKPPARLGEDVPQGLRSIGLAFEAVASSDRAQAGALFGAAVLATQSARDAAWVGHVALRRGAQGAAALAVARAAELCPADVAGAFLGALVAHARGDLARAAALARPLPAPLARAVDAMVAYEASDAGALSKARPALGAQLASVVSLAEVRLAGARALEPGEIARLAEDGGAFGELVAVDAWLDRGGREDLDAASAIVLGRWPRDDRGALRALRAARLFRLRDDPGAAREALAEALVDPSGAAVLEAILLRDKRDASSLRARAEATPQALRPWLRGLERVAAKESGQAKKLLKAEAVPAADAPLLVRMTAALALSAIRDGRGKALVRSLAEAFPQNGDLARPSRGADDEVAPPRGAAPASTPYE